MRIQLKKMIAGVSSIAMLTGAMGMQVVNAATETTGIKPTYDMQLRYGVTSLQADSPTIEVRRNTVAETGEVENDFVGAMRFEIPQTPEGMEIASAKLTLTTERKKDSGDFYVYSFEPETWEDEKINYEDVSSAIEAARASEPLATFKPSGEYGKSIGDTLTEEYNNIAAWKTDIQLSVNTMESESNFDIIISRDMERDNKNQTCFYTKDNVGAAVKKEFSDVESTYDETTEKYTIAAEKLVPELTITYRNPADNERPENSIDVSKCVSNSTSVQSIKLDEDGNTRDAAVSTNNSSIWYLGNYDISKLASVEMSLGLVGQYDKETDEFIAAPQVKLAYMPVEDGTEINEDYIATNSSTIRSSSNLIACIEGLTEPTGDERNGHKYLGAVYTANANGVTVDSDGYNNYPGGVATVGENSTALKSVTGDVAVFVYATAQSRRAVIDYIKLNEKGVEPIPEIPEGAVEVNGCVSNSTSVQSIQLNTEGATRDAAVSTNNSSIWYLGNYDISKLASVEMSLGLVGQYDKETDEFIAAPQVKLACMPVEDGTEINEDYIATNSSTIRSSSNLITCVEGLTEPTGDERNGHKYLGAVYTSDTNGVTVDTEGYNKYPGGVATVGENSTALKKGSGNAAVFVYATAQSCRAVIDYIKLNLKEVQPIPEIPEGAVEVNGCVSNSTSVQSIQLNTDGATRDAAVSTNNSSIWYLGNYDVSKLESVEMSLGLVGQYDKDTDEFIAAPQVKLAYVPVEDGTEINEDYITANSSTIRSSSNLITCVEGLTEPTGDERNGHKYLGAVYTSDINGVTVDEEGYNKYPGGVATVGENSTALKKGSGNAAVFVYATAQSRRAVIDYIKLNLKEVQPIPEIPENAVEVNGCVSNSTSVQSIQLNTDGATRDVAASTNNSSIWYLGNYDISELSSVEMSLGLVGQYDKETDEFIAAPQVKLAYMPVEDGTEINEDYIATNSSTIRSAANMLTSIEGLTEPTGDERNGHKYLGAVYTANANGVTVDTEGYNKYPGGVATVGENSVALKTVTGNVAVFVYATANNCRAAMDYIILNGAKPYEEQHTWTMYTAEYDANGVLIGITTENVASPATVDITGTGNVKKYIWNEKMIPYIK